MLTALTPAAAESTLRRRELDATDYELEQQLRLRTRVGEYMRGEFMAAKRHKENAIWRNGVSVHEWMMRCLRMRNNEHDPDVAKALGPIDVYMPLGSMKCRAGAAWIRDTLANAEEKPWTIEPTPIPELSADGRMAARAAFLLDLQRHGVMLQSLPPEIAAQRIKQLEDVASDMEYDTAREACTRMEKLVHDQLEEGEWRQSFDEVIDDVCVFPGAVVKSPVVRKMQVPYWDGQQIKVKTKTKIVTERVDPLNLYPSADSTTPHDGSSINERMPMTGKALADCIGMKNFSDDAIRQLFRLYPAGYDCQFDDNSEAQRIQGVDGGSTQTGNGLYDVIDFNGRIRGDLLLEWMAWEMLEPDSTFPKKIDADAYYEVQAWHCAGLVLRVVLNPNPLGQRPYSVTSFTKLPGSFWGESIAMMLRDLNRQANSAARRIIQNMAFSSGPIGEVNVDALDESEDRPHEIRPYRVYYTKGAQKGRAINFDKIPSVVAELNAMFMAYWRLSDEVCGIPAYSYGTQAGSGAAATMGGLSLLYNNALKGIKQAIGNLDKYLIEPVIGRMYLLNMLLYPDQGVKADAQAVARGAKGIMAREMRQARTVETLQAIQPFATGPSPIIPTQGVVNLLREWLQLQGFNPDTIFGKKLPEDVVAELNQQEMAARAGAPRLSVAGSSAMGPSPDGTSSVPGTPPPPLDGRQASVVQAMNNDRL